MEHYRGLWNRAYLDKGPFTGWQTFYGEMLSYNGSGETIAVFKLKALHIKKGIAFLHINGIEQPKTVQLKQKWIDYEQQKIIS